MRYEDVFFAGILRTKAIVTDISGVPEGHGGDCKHLGNIQISRFNHLMGGT